MSIFDDIIISSCVSEDLVPMKNRLSEFLRVFLRILSLNMHKTLRIRERKKEIIYELSKCCEYKYDVC